MYEQSNLEIQQSHLFRIKTNGKGYYMRRGKEIPRDQFEAMYPAEEAEVIPLTRKLKIRTGKRRYNKIA